MTVKRIPPCQAACPVHTDAGRYARLVAEGRYAEALEVICHTNPFPSVCAHICQRPCEKGCRRRQLDAPVGIRALKHFVVEHAARPAAQPGSPSDARWRVAVIGAGPAGLTAALDLRRRGCRVSVFERLGRPGGMLNVIPRYRLPQEALDADVAAILAEGIELTCNWEAGRDGSATDLLEKGFDAVVVASGLSRSRGIAVPGFGAQRFTAAIPWMMDVWLGNKADLGRRVAVIGGGNVAADVARTARRLGAEYVALICLESRAEMPAEPEELRLAEAEGIQVLPRLALKRVLNREGHIAAIELMAVTSVFDQAGRFRPTYDPARIRTLNVDMVILSIGQAPDRSWVRGTAIQVDPRGRVVADRETHQTSHPRIFLAGEALRGPGSAIEAVADGHRVAEAVARFLETGVAAKPEADAASALEPYPEETLALLRKIASLAPEPEPFAPDEPVLDEAGARREGGRCLGCLAGAVIDEARCAACLTCFRICPLHAIEIGQAVVANPVRCQACGLCAAVCPAGAIALSVWEPAPGEGAKEGEGAAAIVCLHDGRQAVQADEVVKVPCLARLRPVDILRVFRRGYRTVSLHPCTQDGCKYGAAWRNLESLAGCVRELLRAAWPQAELNLCLPQPTAAAQTMESRG